MRLVSQTNRTYIGRNFSQEGIILENRQVEELVRQSGGKNGKPSWNILASEEERHTVFLMEPGFGLWFLGFSLYLSPGSISTLNKGQIFCSCICLKAR